ncbi:hypothetical protein KS4_31870 [Poriferisphaera corsica]|uniref:Uncharacterized protein n=1 Tax=Poriferisphaera corsica TaxID=2528020 RepID=A0A517YY26_9BACT|nr:hypothetical protein KS4_31870 [Poriferisphaera corsica]
MMLKMFTDCRWNAYDDCEVVYVVVRWAGVESVVL